MKNILIIFILILVSASSQGIDLDKLRVKYKLRAKSNTKVFCKTEKFSTFNKKLENDSISMARNIIDYYDSSRSIVLPYKNKNKQKEIPLKRINY